MLSKKGKEQSFTFIIAFTRQYTAIDRFTATQLASTKSEWLPSTNEWDTKTDNYLSKVRGVLEHPLLPARSAPASTYIYCLLTWAFPHFKAFLYIRPGLKCTSSYCKKSELLYSAIKELIYSFGAARRLLRMLRSFHDPSGVHLTSLAVVASSFAMVTKVYIIMTIPLLSHLAREKFLWFCRRFGALVSHAKFLSRNSIPYTLSNEEYYYINFKAQ